MLFFLALASAQACNDECRQVLQLVNQERQKAGANPVCINSALMRAALGQAQHQQSTDIMSHTGSGGSQIGDRVKSQGYQYSSVSENVAAGQISAQSVMSSWMNSPGHKTNILNPSSKEMGIAHAGKYWAQVFGRAMSGGTSCDSTSAVEPEAVRRSGTGSRCTKTSTDYYGAGPFEFGFGETANNSPKAYPVRYDLLVSSTAKSTPDNRQLLVYGTLVNEDCSPLQGYRVEIWSASQAAIYTSSVEQSYRGAAITDRDGAFSFKTVLPAAYLNGKQYRPKHLHIEVWAPGKQTPAPGILTTQYYFADDQYISSDAGASRAEAARILKWSERSPAGKIIVRPKIVVR